MNQGNTAFQRILDTDDDFLSDDFDDDFFAEDLSAIAGSERSLTARRQWLIDEFADDMKAFED